MYLYCRWAAASPIAQAQVALVVILASLLLVMALLIWRYTKMKQEHEVARIALPMREQFLALASERLLGLLHKSVANAQAIARTLQQPRFAGNKASWPIFNQETLDTIWPVFITDPDLSGVGVLLSNGLMFNLYRKDGYTAHQYANGTGSPGFFFWYNTIVDNQTGLPIGIPTSVLSIGDGRNRPEYIAMIDRPNLDTQLSLADISRSTVLLIRTKMAETTLSSLAPERGYHGGITLWLDVRLMGDFMSKLDLMGGLMYLVTPEGMLFAVSDGSTSTGWNSERNATVMLHARDSPQLVVASAARHIESMGSYNEDGLLHTNCKDVKIKGQKYFIDTGAITFKDFKAIAVVIMPRVRMMGWVDQSAKNVGILVGCIAIGVLVAAVVPLVVLLRHLWGEVKIQREIQLEEESRARAEACTRSSRLFLANLSHDLRTPMASIIGLLEIMRTNGLDAEEDALAEQAQSHADFLHTLLNSILDIDQVEAGSLRLELEPLDLRGKLEAIVDLFSVEGMNKGIDILLQFPDNLPLVIGDRLRLRQIFGNILSNCVKFTNTGYVIIRGHLIDPDKHARTSSGPDVVQEGSLSPPEAPSQLTARGLFNSFRRTISKNSTKGGQARQIRLLFEVEDTGCGVPPPEREAVFENFVSRPDSHSRYGGTGVGLGIVRTLVQLMGGKIKIVNKETPGTVFRFSLLFSVHSGMSRTQSSRVSDISEPRLLARAPSISRLSKGSADTSTAPHVTNLHILMGMADSMHATVTSDWLKERGYRVYQAVSIESLYDACDVMWDCIASDATWQSITLENGACSRTSPIFEGDSVTAAPLTLCIVDVSLAPEPQDEFFTPHSLRAFLLRLQRGAEVASFGQSLVVVWATAPAAPATWQREVKAAGCLVVKKPLLPSRLEDLVFRVREGRCVHPGEDLIHVADKKLPKSPFFDYKHHESAFEAIVSTIKRASAPNPQGVEEVKHTRKTS